MPQYMIIAYLKQDIKTSIFTLFSDDYTETNNHVSSLIEFGFRVMVYEWYDPEEDQMPYYKLCYEAFSL